MIPAAIPALPATLVPGLLLPAPLTGVSVIDVTAAVAVIVWAVGGLVALRLAIRMSRDDVRTDAGAGHSDPTTPHGLRDAA